MQRKARNYSVVGASAAALSFGLAGVGCGAPNDSHDTRLLQRAVANKIEVTSAPSALAPPAREAHDGRDVRDAPASERSVGFVAAALGPTDSGSCQPGMASIEGRFCIDRYEASLVEVLPTGEERPFPPFMTPAAGSRVRAISEANVYPQGYISEVQASLACAGSGKRLCKANEWQQACRGPENKRYGYGDEREIGRCNDNGKNPVMSLFGPRYDASTMNRAQLNQMPGTLTKTGERDGCSNGYGVHDMVGNLHEWVADRRGTFYGGYYQDVASLGHGDGCNYVTTAHEARYHDYSTGFRCCSDVAGSDAGAGAGAAADAKPAKAPRSSPRRR